MTRSRTYLLTLGAIAMTAIGGIYLLQSQAPSGKPTLVVSTTTSLYDTGVLDEIEDAFESENQIDLYFISVGTGLAITHAKRGDADMILVHDPQRELSFLEDGYGVCRKVIAFNFFSIVGPGNDPAGIRDLSPIKASQAVADKGRLGEVLWVSRGDDSGTHSREKGLWASAGFDVVSLREEGWYREAGAGMGKALQIAEELEAYTLTDTGTYLKHLKDGLITMDVLVGTGRELINVYSAVAVNLETNEDANFDDSITFIGYLTSDGGQTILREYGVDTYETALFNPAVELLETENDAVITTWIKEAAFFDGSECPEEYRASQTRLYN